MYPQWGLETNELNVGFWEDVILVFRIYSHFMYQMAKVSKQFRK